MRVNGNERPGQKKRYAEVNGAETNKVQTT